MASLLVAANVPLALAMPQQADPDGPLLAEGESAPKNKAEQKSAANAYVTPRHLRYPYIAPKYIKPIVSEDEPVSVGWYVTDWRHSRARFRDDSARLDVILRYSRDGVDWKTLTKEGVHTGDGSFALGKLPCGTYTIGMMCVDRANGLPSYTAWHEFRVEPKSFFVIRESETWKVSASDMRKYGLTLDPGYERRVMIETEDFSKSSPVSAKLSYNLKKIAQVCLGEVDKYLAANPHRPGKVPGYALYIPSFKGNPTYRSFERSRVIYDAGYDTNAVAKASLANSIGLQSLFDDAATNGFRRLVLFPGIYRVSHEKPLMMPRGIEIDLYDS